MAQRRRDLGQRGDDGAGLGLVTDLHARLAWGGTNRSRPGYRVPQLIATFWESAPEGPLQVGVAHLAVGEPDPLAGRLLGRAHQPGVGEELAGVVEAADVADLVEDRQRQDL